MRTVKLSDLENIAKNGIKIRHVGWNKDKYAYYSLNSFITESGNLSQPTLAAIFEGNYVFYEEPKQVVPDYFYEAYFQQGNLLGSCIVSSKDHFDKFYSDVKWVRFEKVFLKDLEE